MVLRLRKEEALSDPKPQWEERILDIVNRVNKGMLGHLIATKEIVDIIHHVELEAKRAAYRECAEIAEKIGEHHDCTKHMTGNPTHWGSPKVIAQAIRLALAKALDEQGGNQNE